VQWTVPTLSNGRCKSAQSRTVSTSGLRQRRSRSSPWACGWPRSQDDRADLSGLERASTSRSMTHSGSAASPGRLLPRTHGGSSMPFWSYRRGHTITTSRSATFRPSSASRSRSGRLSLTPSTRSASATAPRPMSWRSGPAANLRSAPLSNIGIGSPSERVRHARNKIARNPEVANSSARCTRICSATPARRAFLDELKHFGRRSILARVQKVDVGAAYIARRKNRLPRRALTILRQHPDSASADSASSVFEGLYKSGCVVNQNGKLKNRFAGRGCELSSER